MQIRHKHILSIMLTVAILISGLPRFKSEEFIQSRIGLSDAVLSAKRFVKVSQGSAIFQQSFGRMVSVMNITAGLKTIIQSNDKPAKAFSISEVFFSVSAFIFVFFFCIFSAICDKKLRYRTLTFEPPVPVP